MFYKSEISKKNFLFGAMIFYFRQVLLLKNKINVHIFDIQFKIFKIIISKAILIFLIVTRNLHNFIKNYVPNILVNTASIQ